MTRARRFLHISAVMRRFLWGSEKIMQLSRFVKELPNEHVLGERREENKSGSTDIEVGTNVYHKTFGNGIVDKVYQTSYGRTYDVLFFY